MVREKQETDADKQNSASDEVVVLLTWVLKEAAASCMNLFPVFTAGWGSDYNSLYTRWGG